MRAPLAPVSCVTYQEISNNTPTIPYILRGQTRSINYAANLIAPTFPNVYSLKKRAEGDYVNDHICASLGERILTGSILVACLRVEPYIKQFLLDIAASVVLLKFCVKVLGGASFTPRYTRSLLAAGLGGPTGPARVAVIRGL